MIGLEAKATWESVPDIKATYLDFQLEDKLFPKGGRDVMVGRVYERRNNCC